MTVDELSDPDKVSEKTQNILIGDAMGYKKYQNPSDPTDPKNGKWFTDDTYSVEVTGFMKVLAPKKVSELDGLTSTMTVGEMMGYDKDGGVWYTDSTHAEKVTGIMRAIADFTVASLDTSVDGVFIGDVMGYYTNNPANPKAGIWYQDEGLHDPAAGIMAAFASLTIAEMKDTDNVTNAVKTVKVGEAMGFQKVGGIWYSSYTSPSVNTPVTGVIKAVADSTIGSLETDLNNTKIGEILDYTYKTPENWWYDGDEPTSTMINTIADTKLNALGDKLTNLTVADMFSPAERSSGFLSLLPADAKLTDLGDNDPANHKSMSYVFQNTTMNTYLDSGLITFDDSTQTKLDTFVPGWRNKTIQQFIDSLIDIVDMLPMP